MRVKDDAEAVTLMNDSRYGLTASIWTSDTDAAGRLRIPVETGTWFMNRCDYLTRNSPGLGLRILATGAVSHGLGTHRLRNRSHFICDCPCD